MAKIGIITPYFNYHGGVESVNFLLKQVFENKGHSVEIVAGEQFFLSNYQKKLVKIFGSPFVLKSYFQKQVDRFDVVICNGEFGYGIKHPRCVNLFHGSAHGHRKAVKEYLGPKSSLILYRTGVLQRKAAKGKTLVCVSDFVQEEIYQNFSIKAEHVIENCIDLDLFKKQKNEQKNDSYLFVGCLDYFRKGYDILRELALKGLKIDCVTEKKPCDELGWIPQVQNKQMPSIYSKYKMMLFPSRFEGLSIATLEAMACGLPIVTSAVGLGPKLKKWIPEFVADTHNPQEYYEKALEIEKNYGYFSEKAVTYVSQHHSLDLFSNKWNKLISSLITK